MLNILKSFHNRIARQISHHWIRPDINTGEWIYPSIDTALTTSGILPLEDYITRRRSYLLNLARDRPLLHESQQLQNRVGGGQRYWWSYANQ